MPTIDAAAYHDEILAHLQLLGDPQRVEEARNDKKSGLEFLAIKVPVLRNTVRAGFSFYTRSADEVLAIWDAIWRTSTYFEVMGAALIYYGNQGAKIVPETWPTLSTWQQRVENWAHCDSLSSIYSYLLA